MRNDGPDPVAVRQVIVNDGFSSFSQTSDDLGRLGGDTIRVQYPWIEGEAYELKLLTATGATVDHTIDAAAESPDGGAGFLGLMALIGLYVGVIPVAIGMVWLPWLRTIDPRWVQFLMALTVGLLAFLGIDATLEGTELAGEGAQVFGGAALVFVGAVVAYLALAGVGSWVSRRRATEKQAGASPWRLAFLVALGIGLHNLGEGLAIGSAYAVGSLALGAALVVGFALHNTTEGLAIVAPVAKGEEIDGAHPAQAPGGPRRARGRAGHPGRLHRGLGLRLEPGRLHVRPGGGGHRAGDRPDRAEPARQGGAAAAPAGGGRAADRHRRDVRDRAAGVGMSIDPAVSQAVQDYAKAIWSLQRREDGPVSTSALAERLEVSPASASAMLKRLEELGLVRREPYHGVRALARRRAGRAGGAAPPSAAGAVPGRGAGHALGPRPRRGRGARARHLARALRADRRRSSATRRSIPTAIPSPARTGRSTRSPTRALGELEPGQRGVFSRVSDSDPDMLRWLADRGIERGAELEVVERERFGSGLTVRAGGREHALGERLASAMRVD